MCQRGSWQSMLEKHRGRDF
ncbi:hypothetical protein LINPERPRIM_LOCUS26370 [Linum perenne]